MTKAEKAQKERARIKRQNRQFDRATKAEKRVQIAKDVLVALRSKKFRAQAGNYLYVPYSEKTRLGPDQQVRDGIKAAPQCTVCGIGAVFCASVKRHNDLTMAEANACFYGDDTVSVDAIDSDDMRQYLKRWFSMPQQYLIETAFEGRCAGGETTERKDAAAMAFGDQFDNDHDRLVAIMKNIIQHDGTFVPPPVKKEVAYHPDGMADDNSW